MPLLRYRAVCNALTSSLRIADYGSVILVFLIVCYVMVDCSKFCLKRAFSLYSGMREALVKYQSVCLYTTRCTEYNCPYSVVK